MTKKDYIIIANALKETVKFKGNSDYLTDFVSRLVPRLKRDNARFDEDRFITYLLSPDKSYKERV